MSQLGLLKAFNDHFGEFVDDVQRVFPDDTDILTAKNSILLVRKANPKILVRIWNLYIVSKYRQQIELGNIDFFINKDYSQDLTEMEHSAKIMESIDRLRNPIKMMTPEDQMKSMKYIQNLSKLATMYHGF
jgi:hypothetical protein